MTTPRFRHTATLLANGKILIMRGSNGGSGFLASPELYDRVTGHSAPQDT